MILATGDILCTRNPNSLAAKLIRFGAALRDEPNTVNHVIIVSHRDAGTLWGIEGRPGGVGYVDVKHALVSKWTLNNVGQAKTSDQRVQIREAAKGLLGTPYDWEGIAADAMKAIGANTIWASRDFNAAVPAHVVCSSLADWVYDHVGLESPGKKFDRTVSPADWAELITLKGWNQ